MTDNDPDAVPAESPDLAAVPAQSPDPAADPNSRLDPADDPNSALDPAADPNSALDPAADPNSRLDPAADPNSAHDPAADPNSAHDPAADPTPPRPPRPTGPVKYKGEVLEAERGPGLGCFRFQLIVLVVLIVLTPLSVVWKWPDAVSAVFLFAVIGLLLLTGQTIIFLLRLVAADRRGRRRPLGSATRTVGELEDEAAGGERPGDVQPRDDAQR